MRVLDLFSGIGGFSLGLERAGMRTVAFCEIDPYCQAVLRKHWPGVPIYDDVRSLSVGQIGSIDVICGGFPCQDISIAGRGAGINGERSGLWGEYARLIRELRPRYAIVENVTALLSRGLGRVLGDLAALGYDAEWHCIPASAIGAPHRRDRIWIVAYPRSSGRGTRDIRHQGNDGQQIAARRAVVTAEPSKASSPVADAKRQRVPDDGQGSPHQAQGEVQGSSEERQWLRLDLGERLNDVWGVWSTEPDVGRVANGVPARVDRLRGLGNAVVPQIPEIIGRAIMSATTDRRND